MGIPLKQAVTVAKYVAKQRLRGNKRFPLVLMLEPLYRSFTEGFCAPDLSAARALLDAMSPRQSGTNEI